MHLETLPSQKPTALDPFGLLQPNERAALQQLLEEGIPIPGQLSKKDWKIDFKKVSSKVLPVMTTPVRFNRTTLRFRCDFHPNARGRYIVTAAPRRTRVQVNSVICTECYERRVRFPSFQFRRLSPNPSVCCTNVMDDHGRVSCTGCVTAGREIARDCDTFATRRR